MDPKWMIPLKETVSYALGGAYVVNVAIGNSALQDYLNTYFMTMNEQVKLQGSNPSLFYGVYIYTL